MADEYWHVRVETRGDIGEAEVLAVDRSREWVESRVLAPRRAGEPITIRGRELPWSDIQHVYITRSTTPIASFIPQIQREDAESSVLMLGGPSDEWRAAERAEDMTDELIDSAVGSPRARAATTPPVASTGADPRKVMVVHGRDEEARRAMFDFLRALGLAPQEWSALVAATGSAAPYVGQVLERAFQVAKAVVVLFTPDDEGWLKEEFRQAHDPPEETQPTPQPRPNVLFEAGMALGVHPNRTVLVELGRLRPFSDIYGRHVVRLDQTEGPLREIARRLRTAGCDVDESGSDWARTRFPQR